MTSSQGVLKFLKYIGPLEWALAAACLNLLAQAFPDASGKLFSAIAAVCDVRTWSWSMRILANVVVLCLLIGIRYFPDIKASLVVHRPNARTGATQRSSRADEVLDTELHARYERDAEWAERAKNRLPFS